jgi:deleted-in-malignant-brain-tumors protein 1
MFKKMYLNLIIGLLLQIGFLFTSSYGASPPYDVFFDDCGIEVSDRQPCGRNYNTLGASECQARGCCFDNNPDVLQVRCFLPKRMLTSRCAVPYERKDDCGYYGITEAECLRRGCCYKPSHQLNDPECFVSSKVFLSTDREGILYIEHDSKVGTVCTDEFSTAEANVACRILGFYEGSVTRPDYEDYYDVANELHQNFEDGMPRLTVECRGDESTLTDCTFGDWMTPGLTDYSSYDYGTCSGVLSVYLRCYDEGEVPHIDSFSLAEGDQGLLYVTDDQGNTGTVCDDMFTDTEASVICLSMGYSYGVAVYYEYEYSNYDDKEEYPILLDQFMCPSPTSTIEECTHEPIGTHDCRHTEDIGVQCYSGEATEAPTSGPVGNEISGFSISGDSDSAGLLIVYDNNGNSGTVCDDAFADIEATVVCKSMGYSEGIVIQMDTYSYYNDDYYYYNNGQSNLPILLDEFSCNSESSSLNDCSHSPIGEHDCSHSEDVFIQCYEGSGEDTEQPTIFRTTTAPAPSGDDDIVAFYLSEGDHGFVYVVGQHGQTGSVCDDFFTDNEASVVCKFLGYAYGEIGDKGHHCTDDDKPVLLDNFQCPAECSTFSECSHSPLGEHDCTHDEDAYIQCHDDDTTVSKKKRQRPVDRAFPKKQRQIKVGSGIDTWKENRQMLGHQEIRRKGKNAGSMDKTKRRAKTAKRWKNSRGVVQRRRHKQQKRLRNAEKPKPFHATL